MMSFRVFGAVGATFILASCASGPSLNAEQCAAIDWYGLGERDGAAGQAMTALNDEIIACREFDITPDRAAYVAGREKGLERYCQPGVLLEASVQGVGDPFSCEPLTDELRAAFDQGQDTRAAVQRWQQVSQQYEQLVAQRDQINADGSRLQQALRAETDETRRQQITGQLNYLAGQRDALERQIRDAAPVMRQEEARYQAAVRDYEAFKAQLANTG